MNNTPLVSIVIPVYNGSNYVAEAIESALNQTYRNIEILVINDGSTDGGATDEVVSRYGGRVRYIRKPNGGVATALNLGIGEMRGEYFSWLSHDDLYLPNKVQAQIDFLAESGFPDVVVYTNHYNLIEPAKTTHLARHSPCLNLQFRAKEIVANNQIHGCALLVPRKAFAHAGLFSEKLRVAQDYDLWFRIAEKFPFRLLDRADTTGRVHSQQVGVRQHDRVLIENDEFRLNCLRQLHEAEIASLGGGSRALGLLYLATRMVRMGCPLSHAYLSSELKQSLNRKPRALREVFLATLALGADWCHTTALKSVRKLRHR
jgi:glycosyltransferase involved in cell wall biosynthesis